MSSHDLPISDDPAHRPNDRAADRPADPTAVAWTPQQLARIEQEWRQLQRGYAFHPSVRIAPVHGEPPDEFQVHYRVRTVAVGSTGSLEYRTACTVHFSLPPAFPAQPPIAKPLEAIFHPNVTHELMQILPGWDADSSLASVIERIGLLLAYQTYDPWNVWNPVAFEWLNANTAYLPTDPNANFRIDAGGEPLMRILQHAPQAIGQLREQLQQFTQRLLDSRAAPPFNEIERFAARTRASIAMFQGGDLPDQARRQADELSQWAAQLRQHAAELEAVSKWKAAVGGAVSLTRELASLIDALKKELARLRGLATAPASQEAAMEFPHHATIALPHLPQLLVLQQSHEKLRVILSSARQQRASAAARLTAISNPLPPLPPLAGPLEKIVRDEIDAQQKTASSIAGQLGTVAAAADPILQQGIDELISLERVMFWRRLADASLEGAAAAEQITTLGSDGIEAYFAHGGAAEYGPFQFEQRLDFDEASVTVRNVHRLEVWDLKLGMRLARADAEDIAASIIDPKTNEAFSMSFRTTPRCAVLADHLARAVHQTNHFLAELTRHAGAAHLSIAQAAESSDASWCVRLAALLTSQAGLSVISAAQQERAATWSRLYHELQALGPFKQRVATCYLLTRCREDVPHFQRLLADARQTLSSSNEQIRNILSRCSRDIETDSPIMPAKYAAQYAKLTQSRDIATADIKRYDLLLKTFARHLSTRLQDTTLRGSGVMPPLQEIAPLSQDILQLAPALSDGSISDVASELEQAMGIALWPDREISDAASVDSASVVTTATETPAADANPLSIPTPQEAPVDDAASEIYIEESPEGEEGNELLVDWPSEEDDSGGAAAF